MPSYDNPPIIIGLTGLARSGKSTVAEYLYNRHGFQVIHFADALKAMARRIDPVIGCAYTHEDYPMGRVEVVTHLSDFLEEDGSFKGVTPENWVKENYPEYRRFLQRLGTEGLRYLNDRFWVDQVFEEIISQHSHGASRFVIPDVRFPNEAELINNDLPMNGYVTALVNVVRPGLERGDHASEAHAGRMGEGWILSNDASLMELASKADDLVHALENASFA